MPVEEMSDIVGLLRTERQSFTRSERALTDLILADIDRALKLSIVDLAAETGGNCALTQPGEHVDVGGVHIHGPLHLASRMPTHASDLYARNLYNFLSPWVREGQLAFNGADEILAGALLCRDGSTVHPLLKHIPGEA